MHSPTQLQPGMSVFLGAAGQRKRARESSSPSNTDGRAPALYAGACRGKQRMQQR